MEYTITLTAAEQKALAYVAVSPADWIENAVKERCRLAMEEIFELEVRRMVADPSITSIPADREAVVLSSALKSAAERQSEFESQYNL